MPGDDDHPAPARARGGEVFQPVDADAALERFDRAPPRAPEFEQAGPERGEVFAQQRLARALVPFREAQREVGRGDAAAFAQDAAQQRAEHDVPEPALQGPWQARGQREQADPAPRRPGAR